MFARLNVMKRASSVALIGSPVSSLRGAGLIAASNVGRTARQSSSTRKVDIKSNGANKVPQVTTSKQSLPNLWLRDNCRCQQCVNQDTQQRNFDTFQLPTDIKPVRHIETEQLLKVEWSDGHTSEHPWSWVDSWQPNGFNKAFGSDHPRKLWNAQITKNPPEVKYDAVKNDPQGMADLTRKILVHGFCFVVDSPSEPQTTDDLLASIGPIRNTHYGGFYDFVPDLALADTAYTNLALPAHTDTTYFTEPAGLQSFHLLSHQGPPGAKKSDDDALGGQSLLVDGFNAADIVKARYPEAYETLKSIRVPWHASGNKGIAITPDRPYPVIETENGEIHRVRWNNDDRGIVEISQAEKWYEAARIWNSVLKDPSNEYWFQLTPGRILIFNNWRVLHGRSAFEGVRRICGAYINRDDFISRYRTTNFSHEMVMGRNLNMNDQGEETR